MKNTNLTNGTQNARALETAKQGLLAKCAAESILDNLTEALIGRIMDVLDWFDDPMHGYLYHILAAKTDGDERVARSLDSLFIYAATLVAEHLGTDWDYLADPIPLF